MELCCGSSALTLHLTGTQRQLVPYQGSKWPLRKQLEALLVRLGYWGAPSEVLLSDAGPWANSMQTILQRPKDVGAALRPLVEEGEREPEALYARLNGGRVPAEKEQAAAELLWLQRMAFSGKAVGTRARCWRAQGLNTTSARGVAATERFGAVRPLGRALLEATESVCPFEPVVGLRAQPDGLHDFRPGALDMGGPRVVAFIDPPYVGTTGYPDGDLPRDDVVKLARDWKAAGSTVIICEAEPVAELAGEGWRSECLQEGRGESRARMQARARQPASRGWEWVTYWKPTLAGMRP